jgi:hypothetical protein
MKAKHFLGIGIVTGAFSAAALGAGCGSSTNGTGGTGGTSTTTTSSSKASVTVATGSGGSGGMGGAPSTNTSAATATTVMINASTPTDGNLGNNTNKDWYTFTATAGERVFIAANAVSLVTPAPAANEDTILDTTITVYGPDMTTVLAQDDDAYPRISTDSALFFEAPAAGKYYYTVDSCDTAFSSCGEAAGTYTDFIYQTFVADVGMLNHPEVYAGTAQDGTTAKAVSFALTVTTNEANIVTIDGDSFTATANTHVFSFTVPAGLTPPTGSQLRTELWLQPMGTANGDGSTGNVTTWVTDMTGTTILAQADQKNYMDGDDFTDGPLDLSVPVTPGSKYFLFVQDDNTAPKATDYYFFVHTIDSGNPLQTAATNTSAAMAQVLTTTTDQPDSYFIDGQITALAPTQFWYEVDPPSGAKSVSADCSSARSGSGVQGFTMDILSQVGASGTPTSIVPTGTNKVETATADLSIPIQTSMNGLSIPTGTTKMFLVVSGTGQSTTVTGNSYECGVDYD